MEELKEDGRKSYADISEKVGKTEATVRRRVKKLIKNNIIKKFTIEYELNSKPKTKATVKIEPDFKEIKNTLKQLSKIEEITDIWRLSGDCGLFIKVEIPTIEDFNPLIENKISTIPGVKIMETCFITDIIK
ncbi:MAG: winged helix-turn-helix transcriptional regulator [Candidatus Lokiarchaeota archaeon]|nr:winged helix-turn-helix transcriptional regulator [Candidatus Lokiarchaeota archaeon]MBD3201705.1 winged helix-turn-helix transcriptional regulator [Candidatus Lokiarchaeota archaeon]